MPPGVRRVRGGVVARGEATGHTHRLVGDGVVFRDPYSQQRYVKVMSSAVLVHEEHRPLSLPAGIYGVTLQRQYTPKPIDRISPAMGEQLTFRVPGDLAGNLGQVAREMKRKRSEVLRLALEQFLEGTSVQGRSRPFDLVRDLLGTLESGAPDLGQRHRDYLVARLKRERSSRS